METPQQTQLMRRMLAKMVKPLLVIAFCFFASEGSGISLERWSVDPADIELTESKLAYNGPLLTIENAQRLVSWSRDAQPCRADIRIGMIDSAIAGSDPDLKSAHLVTRDFVTKGRATRDNSHGTYVARLLVGGAQGLIPDAKLYAANIFQATADGERASAGDLLRAVDWLIAQKVQVINLSLMTKRKSATLKLAILKATQQGIVVVAAAGNEGDGGPPAYPAAYKEVVAVTAVDRLKHLYLHANRGDYVDFSAPGVGLLFDGGVKSGTSFAAPFVTAEIARQKSHKQAHGAMDNADLLQDMAGNAQDLGEPGRDERFGWGLALFGASCRKNSAS